MEDYYDLDRYDEELGRFGDRPELSEDFMRPRPLSMSVPEINTPDHQRSVTEPGASAG